MLTLWRPHHDLWRLAREFDSLFNEPSRSGNGKHTSFAPAVDVAEEEDRFVLSADLPGIDEKDVEVTVHEGVLVLSGKREAVVTRTVTPQSRRMCATWGAFSKAFIGTAMAPARMAPRRAATFSARFGRSTATRSPRWTFSDCSPPAAASTSEPSAW